MSQTILNKIKERDRAYRNPKLSGVISDIEKYKGLRNVVVNEISNRKKSIMKNV